MSRTVCQFCEVTCRQVSEQVLSRICHPFTIAASHSLDKSFRSLHCQNHPWDPDPQCLGVLGTLPSAYPPSFTPMTCSKC